MKLAPNFTLEELTATSFPRLQSTPTRTELVRLTYLAATILQPLRDALGSPVHINSGFRSSALNAHVGGVANSRHLLGLAADIAVRDESQARRMFEILRTIPQVDTCLFERSKSGARWLHVDTLIDSKPRGHFNFNYTL